MGRQLRAVARSAVVAFVAGLALWPPRAVYWKRLAGLVGDGVTLVVVLLVALGVGVAVTWLSGVGVRSFAGGGLVAYAVGMVAIEVALSPDGPAHLVWYAALLCCFVAGVALRTRAEPYGFGAGDVT
jgi:hypothetical protein